ncbi:MAG TPA: hypothetical protein VGP72_31705 [Planctomycetota bacterium]|jgi:hypothetical protein
MAVDWKDFCHRKFLGMLPKECEDLNALSVADLPKLVLDTIKLHLKATDSGSVPVDEFEKRIAALLPSRLRGELFNAINVLLKDGVLVQELDADHVSVLRLKCALNARPPIGAKVTKLSLALATLAQHPEWTTTAIAKHVGCVRTYLSHDDKFLAARAAQKPAAKRAGRNLRTGNLEIEDAEEE